MPIGVRLREERERLGMSQPKFAAIAQTTKQTLFSWETEKTEPTASQLAAFADAGVDAVYILTGQRAGAAVAERLPPDEQLLLDAYRDMKAPDRKALLAEMLTGKKAKPAKEAGVSVKGNKNRTVGGDYYKK